MLLKTGHARRPAISHEPVIKAPETLRHLRRGLDEMARLLALTLGPAQGVVLVSRGKTAPEVLTDSGTIARRVTDLPERGADAGAMLLRNMAWTMRERFGDGAATAAVLAQAMVREAGRSIAGGSNAMLIRRGIERGVAAACEALQAQAMPIGGQEMLARLATGATGDPELGAVLGEMFDLLGDDAAILVEEFAAPYLDRAYLEGGRWVARPAARALMPEGADELTLHNPLVLAIDDKLTTVEQVRPALELAAAMPETLGIRPPLLVVARDIGGEALNTLTLNHARGTLAVGAMVLASAATHIMDDLSDIALFSGGQMVAEVLGRPAQRVQADFFGRVRHATLRRDSLTLAGGAGERRLLEARMRELRAQVARLDRSHADWERLRLRAARLAGGIGILRVGAHTPRERELKKEAARKAVRMLHLALQDGVVPGGGVAYLACRAAVEASRARCASNDEAHGVDVVAAALEAPFCQIVANHGAVEPSIALDEIRRRGAGFGFDALTGSFVRMAEIGVLDSAAGTRGALEAAASTATMAITTDVLILAAPGRRKTSLRP